MGEVSEVVGRKILDLSWRIQGTKGQCAWNLENEGEMSWERWAGIKPCLSFRPQLRFWLCDSVLPKDLEGFSAL